MHEKTFIASFVPTTLEHDFKYPYMVATRNLAPMMRVGIVRAPISMQEKYDERARLTKRRLDLKPLSLPSIPRHDVV
jgi:hypothetical protein